MENKEFDRFIKSNTEKDLTPPEALGWENMNIPLPKKKKKREFYFIWFGLLGVILASGYFIFSPNEKKSSEHTIQNSNSISNEKTVELKSEIKLDTKNLNQDNYKSETSPSKTTEGKAVKAIPFSISQKKLKQESSVNIFNQTTKVNRFDASLNVPSLSLNNQSGDSNLASSSILKESQREKFSIQNIYPKFTFLFLPKTDTVKLNLPTFFEPLINPDSTEEKGKKSISLYLSFGLNNSRSNYNHNEIAFHDYVNSAFGNSTSLGVKFNLNKGYFLESGFSYQKIHSTFKFRQPLETLIDTVEFQKIYRTRHVFHNNYFTYLELNLGVGKTLFFKKKWGSEFVLHFNPSFKLSNEGKLLDDDSLIFKIEDFDATPKIFWSADVGLNLFYQWKNNKIFSGVNFKQNLLKMKLVNNSNLNFQPQVLNINLGLIRDL